MNVIDVVCFLSFQLSFVRAILYMNFPHSFDSLLASSVLIIWEISRF